MVFDWESNHEEALSNGIYEKRDVLMRSTNRVVAHHTFRNFKKLKFEVGTLIEDCVFENCGTICFDDCRIEGCAFTRIGTVFCAYCDLNNTRFDTLLCSNDMIIDLECSEISYCRFENVELRSGAYLCNGDADSVIEHCEFSNIRTERDDKEIFNGEEIVGTIFKRLKRFSIVREDTCTGLDCVIALK